MPTLPTPEDDAKKILEICVYDFKTGPGQTIPGHSIALALADKRPSKIDLEASIMKAIELGWLEQLPGSNPSTFIVTTDGHQAV